MAEPRPRMAWVWIVFGFAFLALEIPAALHIVPWATLSSSAWYWLPDWWTWGLVAGLLCSLIFHLSPKRTSVVPVAGFGGCFCCRVVWVQFGPFDWLALLGLVVLAYFLAGAIWLGRRLYGFVRDQSHLDSDDWAMLWGMVARVLPVWPYYVWKWRGTVGIKDRIVRALALRWLGGKVKVWRKDQGMVGKIWTMLNGQKLMLGVLALFVVGVYDQATGAHAVGVVTAALKVLGWMPNSEGPFTSDGIATAVASALAVFGFFHKVYKGWKERSAGATLIEVGTPTGAVKAAYAEGTLKPVVSTSGVLGVKMEGKKLEVPDPAPKG